MVRGDEALMRPVGRDRGVYMCTWGFNNSGLGTRILTRYSSRYRGPGLRRIGVLIWALVRE